WRSAMEKSDARKLPAYVHDPDRKSSSARTSGPVLSANGDGLHREDQRPAESNGQIDYSKLSKEELGLIEMADIKEEKIDWLWQYRLARSEMALMAGEGGIGKSQILLAVAAALSNGSDWPDGSGKAPVGRTIILSAEDSPETTIKPRLRALSANLDRITIVKARVTIKRPDKEPLIHPMSLQDLRYWRTIFDLYPDARLFIVD